MKSIKKAGLYALYFLVTFEELFGALALSDELFTSLLSFRVFLDDAKILHRLLAQIEWEWLGWDWTDNERIFSRTSRKIDVKKPKEIVKLHGIAT